MISKDLKEWVELLKQFGQDCRSTADAFDELATALPASVESYREHWTTERFAKFNTALDFAWGFIFDDGSPYVGEMIEVLEEIEAEAGPVLGRPRSALVGVPEARS